MSSSHSQQAFISTIIHLIVTLVLQQHYGKKTSEVKWSEFAASVENRSSYFKQIHKTVCALGMGWKQMISACSTNVPKLKDIHSTIIFKRENQLFLIFEKLELVIVNVYVTALHNLTLLILYNVGRGSRENYLQRTSGYPAISKWPSYCQITAFVYSL